VRDLTRATNPGPLPFNLMNASTGLFDATVDGGRPRVACPRREWFFTGFIVALGLVALLLLAVPARAATIAESVNDDGGKLVLTDQPTRHCAKDALLAYTSGRRGQGAIFGCWTLDDPVKPSTVFILWLDNREVYTYPAGIFDVIDDEPAPEKLRL
jgi:hypothetical protein